MVNIEVTPLLDTIDLHFLILFSEKVDEKVNGSTARAGKRKREANHRILQLEQEPSQAREDMRSVTEDQQAAIEEVQRANEELLNGSEELQSMNEELITVNQELYNRNDELTQIRKFSEITIAMLHEPLILLDKSFKVVSGNTAFYNTFELTERETIGNDLFTLQNKAWDIPRLREEIAKGRVIQAEIGVAFPSIGDRIICFNIQPIEQENGERLTMVTLDDITVRKKAAALLEESVLRFNRLTNAVPQKIWTANAKGDLEYVNAQWWEYVGQAAGEVANWSWQNTIHPDDWPQNQRTWNSAIDSGKDFELERRFLRHDGTYRWHLSRGVAQRELGKLTSWVGTDTDIDEQKKFASELEAQIGERANLDKQKNNFISMPPMNSRPPSQA